MTRIPQLDEAVEHALRAPSVHNTQPWRWRIDTADGVVELYADRGRRLSATDPDGRDLLISCGAALDHLVVALAHAGLQATTLASPTRRTPPIWRPCRSAERAMRRPPLAPSCSRPSTAATPTGAASATDRSRQG
jgi:hypothetical protein